MYFGEPGETWTATIYRVDPQGSTYETLQARLVVAEDMIMHGGSFISGLDLLEELDYDKLDVFEREYLILTPNEGSELTFDGKDCRLDETEVYIRFEIQKDFPFSTETGRKVFRRADGSAWAGDCQQDAIASAPLPDASDPRWVPGKPDVLDAEILTLSPFFPSGRLGVEIERKSSTPLGRYPNHPPFAGCTAWMPLDALQWTDIAPAIPARKRQEPGL